MPSSLGSLVVSLGLNIAEFTTGMEKSEYLVKKFAAKLDKEVAAAGKSAAVGIAAIGAAAVVAYAAVQRLAGSAANFKDIEERTGASAEALAAFAPSAAVAGTSVDDIATAMNKLAKGLAVTDDETKDLGAGLAALNIPIEQFKQLTPDQQIREVAKAFGNFGEGAERGAVAMAIFGKSGAQLLPFFKELANEGGRFVKLTQQQIERADEFADKQARARAELEQFLQRLAVEALPTITSVITATKEFIQQLVGVKDKAGQLPVEEIRAFTESVVLGFSKIVDAGDGVVRIVTGIGKTWAAQFAVMNTTGSIGDRIAATKSIFADLKKDLDGLADKPFFSRTLENRFAVDAKERALRAIEDRGFTPEKPRLKFTGKDKTDAAASAAAAAAKALFDQQIKDLERFISREKEDLDARESFLQDTYNDNKLSIVDYFNSVTQARYEALDRTVDAYDKEIAAAVAYRAKLTKESDITAQDTKIADIQEKREKAIREAGFQQDKFDRDRARANEQWANELTELTAKTLELRGETAKAAALRFDSQNAGLRSRLEVNGAGTGNLDFQRGVLIRQQALNDRTRDYQLLLEQLGVTQSRIGITTANALQTELDGLAALSKANRDALSDLTGALAKAEEAANDLVTTLGPDNPLAKAAIQGVEQMKLKVYELATTGDLVARKFNDIFANNFASAFEKAVTSTGTLKERLTNLVGDLSSGISRDLVGTFSKDLSQRAFGQGGPLSFIGDFFSSSFGGKDTGALTLTTAGTTLNTAGAQLITAAAQLSVAAATMGGGSAGGSFGSIFSSLFSGGGGGAYFDPGSAFQGPQFGFAASGTDYWRGGDLVVGENGPELLRGVPPGARVTPNHKMKGMGGSPTVIINQTIPPNVDTRSVRQQTVRGMAAAQNEWKRR